MLIISVLLIVWMAGASSHGVNFFNSSASIIPPISHSDMAQLLELCYPEAPNPIAVSADLVDAIHRSLINTKSPLLVIDQNFVSKNVQLYYPSHPLYILSADSVGQLKNLLMMLKSWPLWNIKSTFFIIGSVNKFCRDSGAILRLLWGFQLLSAFMVCSKTNNQTMLYTHNPYTTRAPDPWVAVRKTENPYQRWTLFKKPFKNDPEVCKTLDFDRTRSMDGYPAKIINQDRFPESLRDHVFPSLNMTEDVYFHDESQNTKTMADFLASGDKDISTGLYFDEIVDDLVDRVPVSFVVSYVIVTQKRSFTFSFREVTILFDWTNLFTFLGVLLLIFLIILINNRYHISSAFFDVFKLLLSMGMDSPLGRLSMKFMFFIATLFMFVFEPQIESQLFALLARPQSYTIETLQDLYKHQYHVYYKDQLDDNFLDAKLWTTAEGKEYLHPQKSLWPHNCLEQASKNNSVACVYQAEWAIDGALKKNLYISKKFVFQKNSFYWSRKDWALKDRVYKRLLNVKESGSGDLNIREYIRNKSKKKKAQEKIEKKNDYDEIANDNMYYAHMWFAMCLFLGVSVFFIECLVGLFRK